MLTDDGALPLAIPSYVIAFVVTDLLDYTGLVEVGAPELLVYERHVQNRWDVPCKMRIGVNTGRVLVGAIGNNLRLVLNWLRILLRLILNLLDISKSEEGRLVARPTKLDAVLRSGEGHPDVRAGRAAA